MKRNPLKKTPRVVLRSFFSRMNRWEVSGRKMTRLIVENMINPADAHRESNLELSLIFKEFVVGRVPRRQILDHPYSVPPLYSVSKERIIDVTVSGNTAVIITDRMKDLFVRLKYQMRRVRGEWKILNNRCCVSENGEESPWDL